MTTREVSDDLDGAHALELGVGLSNFGMWMGLVDAHRLRFSDDCEDGWDQDENVQS